MNSKVPLSLSSGATPKETEKNLTTQWLLIDQFSLKHSLHLFLDNKNRNF